VATGAPPRQLRTENVKKGIYLALAAFAVVLFVLAGKYLLDDFTVAVPTYPPMEHTEWLEQNWTPSQREWFYHADQGTQTFGIPYEWFIALEQPSLSLSTPGLLGDSAYLDRYGFIASGSDSGKMELPIGFAYGGRAENACGAPWLNPQTDAQMTSLGFTCAACHTGRFTYGKTTVIVDGSPALTNVQKFEKAIGLSILYTKYVPFRFDRFARRILGPDASERAKEQLRAQLTTAVSQVRALAKLENGVGADTVEEGFARLDALNHIGNIAFAMDLVDPEDRVIQDRNFVGYSAPVHYPRVWDTPWFAWVQYNGSIEQPMARNAGEALGVGAKVNLCGPKDKLFRSSVQGKTISDIEQLIAGTQPNAKSGFHGLTSPKWPDKILPPIDTALAAKGAALYEKHCQGCHLPPVSDSSFWTVPQWLPPNSDGQSYLDLNMIDISHVGTDPSQAADMKNRTVVVPDRLGIATHDFGPALGALIEAVVNRWYDTQQPPIPDALRRQMNGFRPNGVRALLKYKARPLNGIWATPPYLHNGSVPNLYALLSPVAERPKTFYLGNREYDPEHVGYRTDKLPGGFELDTSVRGNSNAGHEFNDGSGPGVIGPLLRPDERRALIEYLKGL
jgi:hypothetical protein